MLTLYVFPISHFCEKARWALDHFGLPYRVTNLTPGLHLRVARRFGVRRGSLPLLADGRDLVAHGSSKIIDWAQANRAKDAPPLFSEATAAAAGEIETRLDRGLGVQVRRHFYSEAMVERPELVRPLFFQGLSFGGRVALAASWSRLRGAMVKFLDLGPDQRVDARDKIAAELDWLDGLLADGRPYLVGDDFGRADLTAASLLAPIAQPPEHPTYRLLQTPEKTAADYAAWRARPSLQWVAGLYATHRGTAS